MRFASDVSALFLVCSVRMSENLKRLTLSDHYNSDAVWHIDIFVELIKVPVQS